MVIITAWICPTVILVNVKRAWDCFSMRTEGWVPYLSYMTCGYSVVLLKFTGLSRAMAVLYCRFRGTNCGAKADIVPPAFPQPAVPGHCCHMWVPAVLSVHHPMKWDSLHQRSKVSLLICSGRAALEQELLSFSAHPILSCFCLKTKLWGYSEILGTGTLSVHAGKPRCL